MKLEYTQIDQAYEEAGRRLKNKNLQEKASAYLGNIWPRGFDEAKEPIAVFAPYLAKGAELEVSFLKMATENGFTPLVATYQSTEYVTANSAIVDCYRAPLILPKNQRTRQWVVPLESRRGQLADAATIYEDQLIVDYWLGIRTAVLEQACLDEFSATTDFSEWYALQSKRFGCPDGARSKSSYYYNALMGLYASGRAVLFDTPPTSFATDVMSPAVDVAKDALGVEPLVTLELFPEKRDWTDLSFLDETAKESLQVTGRISC